MTRQRWAAASTWSYGDGSRRSRSRFGPALTRPIVAYGGGCLAAQRSSAGCSHDISAAVAMAVMMQTISTIALTSFALLGWMRRHGKTPKELGGAGRCR